jgi:rRNA maturation RNase YbeY
VTSIVAENEVSKYAIIPPMKKTVIAVDGILPKSVGVTRSEVREAAEFFAERSSRRIGVPFREVSVVLQDDAFSAEVHLAVNGAEGPTDAITQRYDHMPGEPDGIYGEVYVNCDRALSAAPRRAGWSAAKELLLYVAHGMDHLSGADDLSSADYDRMRRRELAWLRAFDAKRKGGKAK